MPAGRKTRLLVGWMALGPLFLATACGGGANGNASGPGSIPAAVPPSVASLLLVTVDTWRWDYIGVSGSGKVETPTLDRLAAEGVYEPEAETPCPLTTPAHATILTGFLPTHHRVLSCVSHRLPSDLPTLAEAFKSAGYATAAFLSSQTLASRFGLGRGFDRYDDSGMAEDTSEEAYWDANDTAMRDGVLTTQAALGHLRALPAGQPALLWVHYFDLHLPYRPRPGYDARYPGDPYAAQAAFVDDQIGRLTEALETDTSRTWRIVVVGDHGEGLGDHGEKDHGLGLYRSTVHVPLIFCPKPDRPLEHPRPWRLEDLDPTIREWFDLPAPTRADGVSLFRGGAGDRDLPLLTILPSIHWAVQPSLGVRRGSLVFLRQGGEELYDLAVDPGEAHNLAGDTGHDPELAALRSTCDALLATAEIQAIVAPTLASSPSELQRLEALGYVSGPAPTFAGLEEVRIQKVMEDKRRFEQARADYRATRDPDPMLVAYREILAGYPRIASFQKGFGLMLLQTGNQEEAFTAFSNAVRLNPGDAGSRVNLGTLYLIRGDVQQARDLLEAAIAIADTNPVAHLNLGVIYAEQLNDPARAVAHYRRFLELAPGAPDGPLIRAYIQRVEAGR